MKAMQKLGLSPEYLGILQALIFLIYIFGIARLMISGNRIFGPQPGILGPMLFLALFVFSAIFSAGIFLGYPFYLFWEKKDLSAAARIVTSSAISLFVFIVFSLVILTVFR